MRRALRLGTLIGAAALAMGLLASPASAQTIACNLPTGAGVITPYAGAPGVIGSQGTDTIATVTAHCLSIDGSDFTASLSGAIFYTIDATVCTGGSGSTSARSTAGQADPVLILTCHTGLTSLSHFTSPQIGHAIVTAGSATESNYFVIG